MLIFVYGENSYLSREHVEKMRAKFRVTYDQSGMNLAEITVGAGSPRPASAGASTVFGDVAQAVQSPPFLGTKRMVILRGLLEAVTTKPLLEPWIEIFSRIPESTIVIILEALPASKIEKSALFKAFAGKPEVHTYDFSALSGSALIAWARSCAKDAGLIINDQDLQHVLALVGNDCWQIAGELKKLAAFSNGAPVTREAIADLVKANFEDHMFDFVDAVSQKNNAKAWDLLHAQRESGSTDFHLFSMLIRQIRLLLGARSVVDANVRATKDDVAAELAVHPFVAQKLLSQSRNFDVGILMDLHRLLLTMETKLKTGGIKADVAVDRVVAGMLQK